jgi:hypothetical protein
MGPEPEPAPERPEERVAAPARPHRPLGVKLAAGALLAVAIVLPLLVFTYAQDGPRLWGFPFFYWYQFLWVFISAALTYGAYLIVGRADRRSGTR